MISKIVIDCNAYNLFFSSCLLKYKELNEIKYSLIISIFFCIAISQARIICWFIIVIFRYNISCYFNINQWISSSLLFNRRTEKIKYLLILCFVKGILREETMVLIIIFMHILNDNKLNYIHK